MSDRYDEIRRARESEELLTDEAEPESDAEELEEARENVFDGWPAPLAPDEPDASSEPVVLGPAEGEEPELAEEPAEPHAAEPFAVATEPEPNAEPEQALRTLDAEPSVQHTQGELTIPPDYSVLEGEPNGSRRAVGIVVSRFNGDVTTRLLGGALEELARAGVNREAITIMPVPGAFELPLAAMALAKTRRFAGVVALGCVIRGETPHFEYVASEAASGLQLAALETGVPVAFGVLTLDRADQAEGRLAKGAEAVRTVLEMADLFANLRAAAAR